MYVVPVIDHTWERPEVNKSTTIAGWHGEVGWYGEISRPLGPVPQPVPNGVPASKWEGKLTL